MAKELTLASYLPTVPMAKAIDVIKLVSEGNTVTKACQMAYINTAGLRAACKKEPMLQEMLNEALSARNEYLNDMLINIDELHSDAKMAAVVSKNIQWVLERNEPEKFAGRTVDPNNENTRLLAEALNKAMDRVPLAPGASIPQQSITDVSFVDVTPRVATEAEMRAMGLIP